MLYKVTKKFARGSETPVGSYKTMNEAKSVIQMHLADDAAHKVVAIYCLYEGMDLLQTFDQSHLEGSSPQGHSGQSGAGQRFSPTPFNTAPAPRGMPRSGFKEHDDKKDDKNKE